MEGLMQGKRGLIMGVANNHSLAFGKSALYLLSDLSSGVTGEIHYVDSGYNIVSMPTLEELKSSDAERGE